MTRPTITLTTALSFVLLSSCLEPIDDVDSSTDGIEAENVGTAASELATAFISEEDGQGNNDGAHCPTGEVAVGLQCRGSYCDDIRLMCAPFPGTLGPKLPWSPFFSSGGPRVGSCVNEGDRVTGVQCRGSYCDEMRIQCRQGRVGDRALSEDLCINGPWLSEEDPGLDLTGSLVFMKSMECDGWYCDNIKTRYCTADDQICSNHACTFDATADCQCDADCTQFGDCCSNYSEECELI